MEYNNGVPSYRGCGDSVATGQGGVGSRMFQKLIISHIDLAISGSAQAMTIQVKTPLLDRVHVSWYGLAASLASPSWRVCQHTLFDPCAPVKTMVR